MTGPRAGQPLTVLKLDHRGRETWRYPATVLKTWPGGIRVEAFFDRESVDIGPVVFRRGDRFVECYFVGQWYNVFAVYAGRQGGLKGWYCNLCSPPEWTEDTIRSRDLELDLWVDDGGRTTILDQAAYQALPLGQEERRQCDMALTRLLTLARVAILPR